MSAEPLTRCFQNQLRCDAQRFPRKARKTHYDVVVIGSGLAGMTAANILARAGRSVLLLEQHYKLGGMATWFKRPGGHIFDISLHGFPHRHDQELPAVLDAARSPIRSCS